MPTADTDDGKLKKDVIESLYYTIGLTTLRLPEGVVKVWCSGFWLTINYRSESVKISIPENAEIIIGEKNILQPAEV
jgi:beta-galactosidase